MYSRLKIKGVLIGCGFLSDNDERQNLLNDDYINKFSEILAQSLANI